VLLVSRVLRKKEEERRGRFRRLYLYDLANKKNPKGNKEVASKTIRLCETKNCSFKDGLSHNNSFVVSGSTSTKNTCAGGSSFTKNNHVRGKALLRNQHQVHVSVTRGAAFESRRDRQNNMGGSQKSLARFRGDLFKHAPCYVECFHSCKRQNPSKQPILKYAYKRASCMYPLMTISKHESD
jgi:hypothetical protein